MTSYATAQDIVDALIQLREDRAALDEGDESLEKRVEETVPSDAHRQDARVFRKWRVRGLSGLFFR